MTKRRLQIVIRKEVAHFQGHPIYRAYYAYSNQPVWLGALDPDELERRVRSEFSDFHVDFLRQDTLPLEA